MKTTDDWMPVWEHLRGCMLDLPRKHHHELDRITGAPDELREYAGAAVPSEHGRLADQPVMHDRRNDIRP